ncbi:hypothetical protein [Streptomyces griseocarneus]|uniref:hypothetical protein n=1 Tax=Streptomyces griseocarneus TaxID=51201 RepID=UPI001CC96AA2|nr:hypothetical protein [Streptomyces griseocarneus]MBZ6476736.1 hypothetical protein [Streptomyces griseocarneus]
MTATLTDGQSPDGQDLVARLRGPVRDALSGRADALRRALPPRPHDARGRYQRLRALGED